MMAKTRLTKYDRENIRDAIIAHKFEREQAAFLAEENALAIQARAKAYGDYVRVMEDAPQGAFREDSDVAVNVSGRRIVRHFGADHRATARIFCAHAYDPIMAVTDADKFGAKVLDWATRREANREARQELRRSVMATLDSFTTFDALVAGWPEAERFVTEQWRKRGTYAPQVPAVAVAALSKALDLPPGETAEAA